MTSDDAIAEAEQLLATAKTGEGLPLGGKRDSFRQMVATAGLGYATLALAIQNRELNG